MALTQSNALPKGTQAPGFSLVDTTSGRNLSLSDVKGEKGTVVMFICNHCPYVVFVNPEIVRLARDFQSRGIGFVAISSNDISSHPMDGPIYMKQVAEQLGYTFPYLYDETQEVAKAYDAACTPDFYVYDGNLESVYHGQLDDARPGNGSELNGTDMREVLDALLEGKSYSQTAKPSIGCNIKWKA